MAATVGAAGAAEIVPARPEVAKNLTVSLLMSDQPGWQQPQQSQQPPPYGQPGQGPLPPYGQAPPLYGQAPQFGQTPYGTPYGVPGYVPPRNSGTAIAALVVSILSFTTCPLVAAIIALILANNAKREILLSGGTITGESMVTAAKVISWINIGVSIVFAVIFLALFVIAVVSGNSSTAIRPS